jgi:D-tyrosyl-tRNA(Tyr) deacylase
MRAVVQRVRSASVEVEGRVVSAIGPGALVLVGVARGDGDADASALADKIVNLRIFDDDQAVMNRSLAENGLDLLLVSQFTLLGDARKGRRPSYIDAASADEARRLYEDVAARTESALGRSIGRGVFRAMMRVALVNDGPVTILLDTRKLF